MEILPFASWDTRVVALPSETLVEMTGKEGATLICAGGGDHISSRVDPTQQQNRALGAFRRPIPETTG
jgi:hypothetical protein